MATKLGIYNQALREIGDLAIDSLSEAVERRYVLDGAYDSTLAFCLEAGQWNFAIRKVEITSNPSVSTAFGYAYVFDKPDDWIRTTALSASEYFDPPLMAVRDETAYWFADVETLYVAYVSNDVSYGLNLGAWPESFTRYVELELATRVSKRVNQSDGQREALIRDRERARRNAMAKDAQNDGAPRYLPTGRLVSARLGGSFRRYDRA